jgi:hypothetical protein
MLHDDEFSRTATVDRYGRGLPKGEGRKQLKRFYQFDEEEEDDDADDDDEVEAELKRVGGEEVDFMREGLPSDEEESSSEEDDDVEEGDEETEFPDRQGGDVPMGEVSARIAVVNLDWDNIRAEDLLAVFSSFTPSGGRLLKVSVYPSEFGRERMEKEETEGPPKEIFASKSQTVADESESEADDENGDNDDDDEKIKHSILKEDKGEEFDSAVLRRYQLERLRYYYAVLIFSSPDAAKAVYDAVDGTEYLSTANFFDLRFIPDETDFSDDKPRDECERIPDGYKPTEFVTDALQHSKVKLTWDADDAVRKEAQAKAFRGGRKEIDENDLKAYLGSDSENSSVEDNAVDDLTETATTQKLSKKEAERQRMRALLGLSTEPLPKTKSKTSSAPVGDMQITFSSGLSSGLSSSGPKFVFENSPLKDETTAEKYVRREKERRARRKEKMKAPKNGSAPEDDPAPEAEGKEDLGFDDPFFTSTAAEESKAASSAKRKEAKRLKREQRAAEEAEAAAQKAELELLMAAEDGGMEIEHFDMNEIEKAEKKAKKRGNKGKIGKEEAGRVGQEGFEMDVGDERFERVFEDGDFAIDPTNPRYRGTEGMRRLLEEGRKRRKSGDEGDGRKDGEDKGKGVRKEKGEGWTKDKGKGKSGGEANDWKLLVEKFKGKEKLKASDKTS